MNRPDDDPLPSPDASSPGTGEDSLAERLADIDDRLIGTPVPTSDSIDIADAADAALLADQIDVILRLRAAGKRQWPAASSPHAHDEGLSIGPFAILHEIGRGGFAVVYEAVDRRLDRRVALKVIRPETPHLGGSRERFLHDARLASRINHPDVVTMYEVGEADGFTFIAQELCSGGSLADWLAEHPGPVDPRLAAEVVRRLACAADVAHRHNVLHRDINPSNVLLIADPDGPLDVDGLRHRLKLGDFGIGKLLADEGEKSAAAYTHADARPGTPAWMAPEQYDPEEFGPVGPRTDVHALGLLLDRLLTGIGPHDGRSPSAIYRRMLREEPRAADAVVPGLPRDIVAVGLKARSRRPQHRYASAADFAADLARFADGIPTVARPRSALERCLAAGRRHAGVLGVAAALVVAVVAVGYALLSYRDATRRDLGDRVRERAESLESAFDLWRLGDTKAALDRLSGPTLSTSLPARWLTARARAERQRLLDRADPQDAFRADRRDLYCLAVAGDGGIAAGAADGTLFLFAPGATRPTLAIPAHDEINDVVFSPDGRIVATVGEDGAARLWQRDDGSRVAEVTVGGGLFAVAFSPKGDRIAFGGRERTVDVQALGDDGIPFGAIVRHEPFGPWSQADGGERPDTHAIVFLDAGTIAAASGPDIVALRADGGDVLRRSSHAEGNIGQIVLSPDAATLVTIGTDHTPHLWDAATGKLVRRLPRHPSWVQGCGISPDGTRVATGCRDGIIRVFDAASGAEERRLVGHAGRTWDLIWENSGLILSCGADGTIRRWDTDNRPDLAGLREVSCPHGPVALVARLGPPGDWLVAATEAPGAMYDVDDGVYHDIPSLRFRYPVQRSRSGADDRVVLFDADSAEAAQAAHWPTSRLLVISAIDGEGPTVNDLGEAAKRTNAVVLPDGTIAIASHEALAVIDIERGTTRSVGSFAPVIDAMAATDVGSTRIAIGSGPTLWVLPCDAAGAPDATRARAIVRRRDHIDAYILCVAWSPDGTRIAFGTRDRTVQIVDAARGTPAGSPMTVGATPLAIAWSSDGRSLVVADRDSVRLADADTGTTIDEIRPGWPILSVGLEDRPDHPGVLLIAGGQDRGRLLALPLGTP